MLEKAIHLLGLLEDLHSHPFLRGRWALKGGTALNLFIFDVPRLSVDIDVNYVGAADRDAMLAERPGFDEGLQAVFSRRGYDVRRVPDEHAGGKWYLRYASASGQGANLEVDVNYMLRVPLWPIDTRNSGTLGSYAAHGIPVLDIHELAAGKLVALLARASARDLFDAHLLLTQGALDTQRLRLGFVVCGAMNRRDWRTVTIEDVDIDPRAFGNELTPLVRRRLAGVDPSLEGGAETLVEEMRERLAALLPFGAGEKEFLDRLLDRGEIAPGFLAADPETAERIGSHPMLQWKALHVRRHRSG